jgi:hypothetical protein
VLEANKLTAEAPTENTLLKDELKKLKKNMKDEQEARREAAIIADEKEGALRESITNLLGKLLFIHCAVFFQYYLLGCLLVTSPGATDMPVDRTHKIREDSMSDALSLASDSNNQVQGLLQKTKGALSKLFSMMFPKLNQNKTLGEMADTFFLEYSKAELPSLWGGSYFPIVNGARARF